MGNKIDCSIVRDLLPNYMEKLTSDETNASINEHLLQCPECQAVLASMSQKLDIDRVPEIRDLKRYLKKTKSVYLVKGLLLAIGILGILVSFIVDIAVNRRLTWSLIVDASVIYLLACGWTAVQSKTHKILRTLAAATVLTLPLIWCIEWVVNRNYLNPPIYWFTRIGLPVTLIWIVILWFVVIVRCVFKANLWTTGGMILLFSMVGSLLTEMLAEKVTMTTVLFHNFHWIDSLAYIGCALACLIIGYRYKHKNK